MKKYVFHVLIFLALTVPALAQEMPPPRRMPREPVSRQSVTSQRPTIPASREIQGQATVVDSERLRIGDFDLRLFGIVPPQLSASFGPQARAALDQLTAGQVVSCTVRDRDREGRFLATCHNANNADLALELLKRGLAVAARGSLAGTEVAASYLAAEQAAETQKTGLWSVTAPAAAAVPEVAKPPVAASVVSPVPPIIATLAPEPAHPHGTDEKPSEIVKVEPKPPEIAAVTPPAPPVVKETPAEEEKPFVSSEPSFIVRYQLLITGLVMLATALGMLGAIAIQRMLDRRTEMKAIAAAFRGELMAARAVCFGRLKTSMEIEDKDIPWPRIRSTLYQAYVGRLGWLGAELARRVASIYGQANDYASYYDGSDDTRSIGVPKRQALQVVINRIDEVLPRLAIIEQTGGTLRSDAGLPKIVPGADTVPPQISPAGEKRLSTAAVILPPIVGLWTRVRDLAQASWPQKKAKANPDPIAEYTALIEEEMKRFAFDEGEDAHSDVSVTKIHGGTGL